MNRYIKKLKNFFTEDPVTTTATGYKYIEPKEEIDLIRLQLKGITLNFLKDNAIEDNLSEKDKDELYANANLILNNNAFKKIKKHIINLQGNYSIKEAENMSQVAFGRATINGILLFNEELERLSALHKEKTKPEEDFDKHDLI